MHVGENATMWGVGVIQSSQWLKSKEHEWIQEDEDEWNLFPTKGNKLESPQILALFFFSSKGHTEYTKGIDISAFKICIFYFEF